ncbi:hypothetical protein [Deinococcus yunweiensis]|uniref:hypothetical protein n=1 Tax=Deinococcus yunweiensis TaxID=367282 RepID=UPI00398F0FEE
MRVLTTALLTAALALTPAHAQTRTSTPPKTEQPAVWLGLGTEAIIIPELQLAASVPVYRSGDLNVSMRGNVDATFGLYALGADVLLNQGNRGWYGGPSAAVIVGGARTGWAAGGLAGYRTVLGEHLGFFVEGRVRYLYVPEVFVSQQPLRPGQPVPPRTDLSSVLPGLHLGLTYRF